MANRREFLQSSLGVAASGLFVEHGRSQEPGVRPTQTSEVKVLNPKGRVPLSFIIDDSTCLVNLAHYCIPQFAEVFPDRYKQPWRSLPREIPDSFVRKFGEWSRDHGVKGKYSIVPYPACVGWIDRDMTGWSRRELTESLRLVRDFMTEDWDIHPEMVTHTWVINTKTGRPYKERSEAFMENWGWSVGRSADELADYLAYALRLIRNVGLPCEGITTPGGFGSRSLKALSEATLESVRDVFSTEIPHYFRHLYTDNRSVAPRVENASDLNSDDPKAVVSIIGCTGDWFGGWDGLSPGSVELLITQNGQGGRLPEVINQNEPAIMVCHWPGIYYNGEELGFKIFQEAVRRLDAHYRDQTLWMKLSEIARYWAAKTLTRIDLDLTSRQINFQAPFASKDFTLEFEVTNPGQLIQTKTPGGEVQKLTEVASKTRLRSNSWCRVGERLYVCFDLIKGKSVLQF